MLKTHLNACINYLENTLQLLGQDTIKLQERIFRAYYLTIYTQLQTIQAQERQTPLELSNLLTSFLAKNWQFINGTCLSYLVLPNNEVTEMCCDMAEKIKLQLPGSPLSAINILIPTLSTESISDQYPSLVANNTKDILTILKTHILG